MSSQEESSSSLSECLSAWRGTLPKAALDADRAWRGRWASGGRLKGLSGDDHMVLVFRSYVRFFSIHSGAASQLLVLLGYDGGHCLRWMHMSWYVGGSSNF